MGYVVGILASSFVPDASASCALPPERTAPDEESASEPRAEP